MKILYLIFGGWSFFLISLIWGTILGLVGLKEQGESLKGISAYILNPTGFDRTGELGDNTVFNVIFLLFFGGIGFIIHSFVIGFILGLIDKELGQAISGNAMGGLSLATNKWTAK
ncbi:MAG: hypothetical protein R3Y05_02740 [bacterium]